MTRGNGRSPAEPPEYDPAPPDILTQMREVLTGLEQAYSWLIRNEVLNEAQALASVIDALDVIRETYRQDWLAEAQDAQAKKLMEAGSMS